MSFVPGYRLFSLQQQPLDVSGKGRPPCPPAVSREKPVSTLEMKQTAATVKAGSSMCPEDAHFPLTRLLETGQRVSAILQHSSLRPLGRPQLPLLEGQRLSVRMLTGWLHRDGWGTHLQWGMLALWHKQGSGIESRRAAGRGPRGG